MVRFFETIGDALIRFVNELGAMFLVLWEATLWLTKKPFRIKEVFHQFEFIGVQSMSIIVLTSAFAGAVFALQSSYAFGLFDANSMIGSAVALVITRELGPVLTALMIAGRCGSAMAAQIGTMRVTEQIDALAVMAVNPIQFLFVPRLIAGTIMLPMLTVIFDFVSILGALVVSFSLLDIAPSIFWENIVNYVELGDFTNGLVKAMFFGFIISLVGCYKGYTTTRGAEGVGQATTASVVVSSVAVLVSDYFLTAILFAK